MILIIITLLYILISGRETPISLLSFFNPPLDRSFSPELGIERQRPPPGKAEAPRSCLGWGGHLARKVDSQLAGTMVSAPTGHFTWPLSGIQLYSLAVCQFFSPFEDSNFGFAEPLYYMFVFDFIIFCSYFCISFYYIWVCSGVLLTLKLMPSSLFSSFFPFLTYQGSKFSSLCFGCITIFHIEYFHYCIVQSNF